jgi:hypothetical protein
MLGLELLQKLIHVSKSLFSWNAKLWRKGVGDLLG